MSKVAGFAFVGVVASLMAVVVARDDTSPTAVRPPDASYQAPAKPSYACDFASHGVRIHAAAHPTGGAIGEGYRGDGFSVRHWYAPGSPWAYGTDLTTGRTGWVDAAGLSADCRGEG